jgi:HlyD family secretion protein
MKARRVTVYVILAALVLAGATWALWPAPVPVEMAPVTRGPLRVIVEGPGKMRVRDRYLVTAPVPGHLGRVARRAGDDVRGGDVVATVFPVTPAPIDDRARGELRARLEAARAVESEARSALERSRHAALQAERERERARSLARGGSLPARDLDVAEAAADEAAHGLEMASAALRRAEREAEATRIQLEARAGPGAAGVVVRAPAPGRVLRVLQESEGPVAAGTPILEIGDPGRLELRLDLLTTEAVRVQPGAPVEIVAWGGAGTLRGRVRLVEPSAFTKVSALGVEEQRVNVIVDPVDPAAWAPLADGFAADGHVVVAERGDALRVPVGALFRVDGGWAVFAAEGGRARLRTVRVGDVSGTAMEVLEGLSAGDLVLVHPGDRVTDGGRVRPAR